jgi:peptidoglycan/LPS O-acetylase OafA/YrhL
MIIPLETFRGICAIVIVFYHLKINTFIHTSSFIQNGELVVDFFFVLSGFVIALNYMHKIDSKKSLINFQKKRFYRLYPLHLLTLFIFLSFEIGKWIVVNNTSLTSTYEPFNSFNNFYSLFSNLILIHGWYGWSFNLPSWSISTEFYTYLIFGIIVLNFGKNKTIFLLMIFLSLVIFFLNNYGFIFLDKFIYPARCIYSFFIGVLTFCFYAKHKDETTPYLFLLLSIIINIALITQSDRFSLNYEYIILPISFSLTIFFASTMKKDNFLFEVLSNKFLVYLGSISYGVYMIHFAVVWCFRQVSKIIFKVSDINNNILLFDKYTGLLLTIMILGIIIFLSHISLNYFENKFKVKS